MLNRSVKAAVALAPNARLLKIPAQSVGSGDAPQMLPASAEKTSDSEMLLSRVVHNKCFARDVRKLTVTSGKPDLRERISRRVQRG